MPRLKVLSGENVIKILESFNFAIISQKGSHAKFRKLGKPTLTVIVPANRKEIPFGRFRSILRQSGLTEKDFN